MNATMWDVAPEVTEALAARRAIVALESTLVAHGLPWPVNLETARAAEAAVRAAGAVPATIALLGGRPRVGLSEADLEHLASAGAFHKASLRDLAAAAARGLDAATTVAATLWVARRAGIPVMATGGIGGVHRDAARTWDVSADLDELARGAGRLVVCSGIKSILDVPATLEALETRGVPVIGYRTGELPAFTARSSGLSLDWRVESADEAAAVVRAQRRLRLRSAVLLVQAVPPAAAVDDAIMDAAITEALTEAERRGIAGKATTPFLLDAIRRATGGRSLEANRALIIANAALAAEVAVRLEART
jgi:pseudouridine-5'-phosphate glycosidase